MSVVSSAFSQRKKGFSMIKDSTSVPLVISAFPLFQFHSFHNLFHSIPVLVESLSDLPEATNGRHLSLYCSLPAAP